MYIVIERIWGVEKIVAMVVTGRGLGEVRTSYYSHFYINLIILFNNVVKQKSKNENKQNTK